MGSTARRSSDELDADRDRAQRAFERHLHARRRAMARSTKLARIIDAFRRELREDKLTFNVGLIGGGATRRAGRRTGSASPRPARPTSSPRPPSRAAICARSAPSRSSARRRRCGRSSPQPLPGAKAEIVFDPTAIRRWRRPTAIARCWPRSTRVNRDLGLAEMGELDPVKRGAGDISFVAADVDGLAGLGPASRGDHAPGETVDIASIFKPGQARGDPDEPARRRKAVSCRSRHAGRNQLS